MRRRRNCNESEADQRKIEQEWHEHNKKKNNLTLLNMQMDIIPIDDINFDNFKGIYFEDDPNRKFQDPETGCHFEYKDLCKRLSKLKILRKKLDA